MGLSNCPWSSVEIPRVPPKPQLMPLTGGYRRTPVLQIGADIYCDTHNIARCLAEQGFRESLFPNGCEHRALLLSQWVDQTLFPLAVRVVITEALDQAPPDFVKDRGDLYFGTGWSAEKLKADLPGVIMQLESSLCELDQSIDPFTFAMGTKVPTYADAAIAYLLWFVRGRWEHGPALLSQFPQLCRIESVVESIEQEAPHSLDATEALMMARETEPASPSGLMVKTALKLHQSVGVRPFGDSSDPLVIGGLRYLDAHRISLDIEHAEVGQVAVHFPISGYQISVR